MDKPRTNKSAETLEQDNQRLREALEEIREFSLPQDIMDIIDKALEGAV